MDATRLEALRLGAADLDRAATAVVHVADRRYLPLALASAASGAAGLSRCLPFRLLLVDVPAETAAAAGDYLRDRGLDAQVVPLDLGAGTLDLSRLPTPRESISPAAYGRLAAADLLSEFDMLIYLDGDTLIDGDLAELAAIRPEVMAACESSRGADRKVYQLNPIDPPPSYFNSGVCVINAAFWRRERLATRMMSLLEPGGPRLSLPDQDVMNLVCGRVYHRLHPRWNFTKGSSWDHPAMRPAVAHFAGRIYPWDPRDRRCPQVYRDRYAQLFAGMPQAVTAELDRLAMPEVELRRARRWWALPERLGLRRRSGWNPAHGAFLSRTAE